MSADNGIYVVKFPDGYRVAYGGAIDNIDFYEEGTKERKQQLFLYFGDSDVFKTKREAYDEAFNIDEYYQSQTEYGIRYLGEYESFLDLIDAGKNES